MQPTTRPVAVVGGNRIPFARSNSVYAGVSNQEMLTAAIDGLADRFDLQGERLGEVRRGAHRDDVRAGGRGAPPPAQARVRHRGQVTRAALSSVT